jgi:hypothetical protein
MDITDKGIKDLTSLTSLYLCNILNISDRGIKKLTNITKLSYFQNDNDDSARITFDGIKKLKKLTYFRSDCSELDENHIPLIFTNTSLMRNRNLVFLPKPQKEIEYRLI